MKTLEKDSLKYWKILFVVIIVSVLINIIAVESFKMGKYEMRYEIERKAFLRENIVLEDTKLKCEIIP